MAYYQQWQIPSIYAQTYIPLQQKEPYVQEIEVPQSYQQQYIKPGGFDGSSTFFLFATWSCLAGSSAVLLYFTYTTTSTTSAGGQTVTPQEIARVILFSAIPLLIATVLNEVLIERCWRRVVYIALGTKGNTLSNAALARNLRAANFELWTFFKRAIRFKAAGREWLSATSYAMLRWGTTISITTVQLCITWRPQPHGFYAYKRSAWLILPLLLHAGCIFGSIMIWFRPPWHWFSNRFNDQGLLRKYQPYLHRVQGGTLVGHESVAKYLESYRDLSRVNKPGLQVLAKLKGLTFGLLLMFAAPGVAWITCRFTSFPYLLSMGETRMAVHFIFLTQNVFYLMALDFAIWNVSLDGLCKTPNGDAKKGLYFLGYSSGTVLLAKTLKQRRPLRACLFLLLFWLQACVMRCLTLLYALCASVLSYSTWEDMASFDDPAFWNAWVILSALIALPPFIIWLFSVTDSPVCAADGWRWAQIAKTATKEEGYYGVKNGEAVWGRDVDSFKQHKGEPLR